MKQEQRINLLILCLARRRSRPRSGIKGKRPWGVKKILENLKILEILEILEHLDYLENLDRPSKP